MIEGLQGGLAASLTRVHHAAIDGVSGEELVVNLLDLAPEPTVVDPPDPPWKPERVPCDLRLVGDALVELCRRPAATTRAAWRTARAGENLLGHARRAGFSAVSLPLAAPRTSLGVPLGPERRVAFAQVSLDEVKSVKGAFDVTVNDVVLAMCSGALRHHLAALDDQPETSAVAIVPVSVRAEHERGTMGNRLSAMFVSLASAIDDPVQRLRAIGHATQAAKAQERAARLDAVGSAWIEAAVPALVAPAIRLGSRLGVVRRVRPGNVIISNIVGPRRRPLLRGRPSGGGIPDGSNHRRHRSQHHRAELPRLALLRSDGEPQHGARCVEPRPWPDRCPPRARQGRTGEPWLQ